MERLNKLAAWVSPDTVQKWGYAGCYFIELIDPCVQPPSDFEDNTYSWLAHWSSVVCFSFCKLHSQFGAVSEESCFSSDFLARGSCPVLQLRPLPSLTTHLAFPPGSAGLARSFSG